jgi:hypothetical protein
MIIGRYPKVFLVAAVLSLAVALSSSEGALRAQDVNKPVIPPQPRTINLTQEQRFIIKENVKDLALSKAPKDAPETIGDPVPASIVLHALPSEVGLKVSQYDRICFSSRTIITPLFLSVRMIVESLT